MAKLIMLSGIPGSGKSTLAKEIAEKEQAVILSSDDIYVELTGDTEHKEGNRGFVFGELYQRGRDHLKKKQNVIMDSTNISAKRRKGTLEQFAKINPIKECYCILTPFEVAVEQDKNRNRIVGKGTVKQMYLNYFVPFNEDGFDHVHYIFHDGFKEHVNQMTKEKLEEIVNSNLGHDDMFKALNGFSQFDKIFDLPQDSTYHVFSVSRHTYYVLEYINEHYQKEDKLVMQYTALFHDIGKYVAKNFKDDHRYANFIGHENVSAQLTLGALQALGYDLEFCLKVTKLVQLHMRLPREDATEKAKEKFKHSVDEDTYEKLKMFREADESAK